MEGEKPTKKDIILLDENVKKLNLTLQRERIKQIIPLLKNNLSSWNQDLQYKLMSDDTIRLRLSRLLKSAEDLANPKAAQARVKDFLKDSGDLFKFYERAESEAPESESEAPESESGPVLCSKCSAPLSRSDLDISAETQPQPSYLESPARRPLERADSQLRIWTDCAAAHGKGKV